MTDKRGPKEVAYDTEIHPLMTQVIALAKAHNINMFATFSLDYSEESEATMRCTTAIANVDFGDDDGMDLVMNLRAVAKPRDAFAIAKVVKRSPR